MAIATQCQDTMHKLLKTNEIPVNGLSITIDAAAHIIILSTLIAILY